MTDWLIIIISMLIILVASAQQGCQRQPPPEFHLHKYYNGDTNIYVQPLPPASQPSTRPSIFDRRPSKKPV